MDKHLNLVVNISLNVMIITFICKVLYLLWFHGWDDFSGKWDHAPGFLTTTFVIAGSIYFFSRLFQWILKRLES